MSILISISELGKYQYQCNINYPKVILSMSISISILPLLLINISLSMHCAPLVAMFQMFSFLFDNQPFVGNCKFGIIPEICWAVEYIGWHVNYLGPQPKLRPLLTKTCSRTDDDIEEGLAVACWENYSIFSVSAFQYIILAYAFSKSKPYRQVTGQLTQSVLL